MTTGEQEKVEGATSEEQELTPETEKTEEQSQAETITRSELDVQINKIKTEHENTFRGLRKLLYEKDRKLKELESGLNPTGSHIPTLKAAIDVLADESSLDPARVQKLAQLRSQLAIEEQSFRLDSQKRKQQQITNDNWEKIQQKATEAGFDPDDDVLESVVDAFEYARDVTGDFSKAHKRLDKVIEKGKKTNGAKGDGKKVEEKKPETEAQLRERIERETLEKYGLNKSEKVTPTGRGGRYWTAQEITDMPDSEYMRLKPEIDKAEREGRIKK